MMIETDKKLMNIKVFFAKGDGETLIDHSKLVADFAVEIAKISANSEYFFDDCANNNFDEYLEILRIAGLLHDISKCTDENQKAMRENKKLPEKKYTHNELGWAFVSKHLKTKKSIKTEVLYLIYWHHGIKNEMSKTENNIIYNTFNKNDIFQQLEFMKTVLGNEFIDENDIFEDDLYSPLFFEKSNNDHIRIFLRSCFISADRLVSGLDIQKRIELRGDKEKINEYILNLTHRKEYIKIGHNPYNNERFQIQKSIAENKDCTIIINAPGGFGKTLIPILYGISNKKKIIFVAPRNTIAESIYNNIIDELNNFKIEGVSIQLYLTGNVKKTNDLTKSFFGTDIIVTNIDNFLRPTVDNKNASKLYFLLSCTVVFDEYHEFVSGSNALLAAFINIMKMRHRLTDSKTFLLSATPYVGLESKWSTNNKPSIYFPERNGFFLPANDKQYKINVIRINENDQDFTKIENNGDKLIIYNSIKKTQIYKLINKDNFLIHSHFEEEYKKNKLNYLFENHGKNVLRKNNSTNVISTSIVQASLNISFRELHESCISPSSTLQRVGRVNRFGELNEICEIYIYDLNSPEELRARASFFNSDLSNDWFEYLMVLDQRIITLNELYQHYAQFHIDFKDKISNFIQTCISESKNVLAKIYPQKIDKEEENPELEKINRDKKNRKAGSNKLRSNQNEVFFIVRRFDEDWNKLENFTDVFSGRVYRSPEHDFDDLALNSLSYSKRTELLIGDERFDYERLIKKKGKFKISEECENSVTPYVRNDAIHHPEFGVIKKELISNYLTINKPI